MTSRRALDDRLVRMLIVSAVFGALVLVVGQQTTQAESDVDQVVFEETLRDMRAGADYYPAMRDALIEKEGAPPSQLRSVRPPLEFWTLSRLPESAWRYASGAAFAAVIVLAGLLGLPYGRWGGAASAGLAGLWSLGYTPLLYLHAEVWGAPFLLGALLAVRRGRIGPAVGLAALATALRELYALAFMGLLWKNRRRPVAWVVTVLLAAYAVVHGSNARRILVSDGKEAPFGNLDESGSYFLSALSPSDRPLGWSIGMVTIVGGAVGLYFARRHPASALATLHCGGLAVVTLLLGRAYWGFTFGPLLAAFAPAALARATVRECPVDHQQQSEPTSITRSSMPTVISSR